jgi:hypothetical protein
MHMVGHEHVGVHLAVFPKTEFPQLLHIARVIFFREKTRLAVIATLHDM